MQIYLNTEEAAAYLGIKDRKLYELVATGGVPCSKVTGKWLFPRAALDSWVASGLAHPEGFVADNPPPIIGGSHDPLLEWALRRSESGLALLSEGSSVGLARLGRNEVAMAAIHLHDAATGTEDAANLATVCGDGMLRDAVVIGFARREQGLVTAPGNPLKLATLRDVLACQARLGQRQSGAGAQLLLRALAAREDVASEALHATGTVFATGQDIAFAIRSGEIDCGVATQAVAASHGLGFVPLAWERFDLVMRRRTYFEPGPQKLFALMREPEFRRHAALLTGYDITEAGCVRLNR